MISLRQLIDARVQFGHVTSQASPKMRDYVWGIRNKVSLIDVSKTARNLEAAASFLESVAAEGKQVLWVGTKRAAQDTISQVAERLNMPKVTHRWVGGTLCNYEQVRKSNKKLQRYEEILSKADQGLAYTKKELSVIQKAAGRLEKVVGGMRDLAWPPGAVVLVDIGRARAALREAAKVGVPVVALVDTNHDPSLVDWVIPANDDAPSSIDLIVNYLGDAVERGMAVAKEASAQAKKEAAEHKAAAAAKAKEKAQASGGKNKDAEVAVSEKGQSTKSPSRPTAKKSTASPAKSSPVAKAASKQVDKQADKKPAAKTSAVKSKVTTEKAPAAGSKAKASDTAKASAKSSGKPEVKKTTPVAKTTAKTKADSA